MLEHISEEDLLLALDGELAADRNEAVREHTRACAACDSRWNELQRLSQEVAILQRPDVAFRPEQAAVASLLSRIDHGQPTKRFWTSHSFAIANTLVAVAVAITCVALLPSWQAAKRPVSHPAPVYDLEQSIPTGFVSLPYADPALPLDDATVLPVELSAEDLVLMGIVDNEAANGVPREGVQAEILIGMDGWPRAIRILE